MLPVHTKIEMAKMVEIGWSDCGTDLRHPDPFGHIEDGVLILKYGLRMVLNYFQELLIKEIYRGEDDITESRNQNLLFI